VNIGERSKLWFGDFGLKVLVGVSGQSPAKVLVPESLNQVCLFLFCDQFNLDPNG
jgi:hypothetical protein